MKYQNNDTADQHTRWLVGLGCNAQHSEFSQYGTKHPPLRTRDRTGGASAVEHVCTEEVSENMEGSFVSNL